MTLHAFASARRRSRQRYQVVLDEIALRVKAYKDEEIEALKRTDDVRAKQCKGYAAVLEELGRTIEVMN